MKFRLPQAPLLALLISFLVLAACQANPDLPITTTAPTGSVATPNQPDEVTTVTPGVNSTPDSSPTPLLTPTLKPLKLSGIEIEFWHPWQGDLAKRAEEAVSDFNRNNEWGVKTSVRPFYSTHALEEAVRISQAQAGGVNGQPSVLAAPPDLLAEWASAGRIADLAAYMTDPGYGFSVAEINSLNPQFLAQDRAGAHQNGLPALRSARVLFYNLTWAKELGFSSPPESPQQLQEQACAAAQENNRSPFLDKRGTGGYLLDTDPLTTLSWMTAFGAQLVPAGPDQPYTFETPEAEDTLEFLRKLLDNGCAWIGRSPTPYDYFSNRMALFYAGTLPDLVIQKRILERAKNTDQWVVLPFPGQAGTPVLYSSGYSYAVMSARPEEQLAGWLLVRWLEKPEHAASLAGALPSLPVSQAVAQELAVDRASFPWNLVLPLAEGARPAPAVHTWRSVQRLLEDAAHQAYYQPADQLDLILPMLDAMTSEILKRTPGAEK